MGRGFRIIRLRKFPNIPIPTRLSAGIILAPLLCLNSRVASFDDESIPTAGSSLLVFDAVATISPEALFPPLCPMSNSPPLTGLVAALRKHYKLWLIPTAAFFLLSLIYAFFGSKKWQASQALLIRDELIGRAYATPGRFDSTESLKSTQEIISEIAHNPSVVRKTLQDADVQGKFQGNPEWPSAKLVEEMQQQISVIAPGGAEFGKTEMVEIRIIGRTPEQAKKLLGALANQVEEHLREVRADRAESMALELNESVILARGNLEQAAEDLQQIETALGSDLVEMRNLNSPNSLSSSLQSSLIAIRAETRQAVSEDELVEKQVLLLTAAQDDVAAIKSTPEEILKLLPVLNDLKQGLATAQLSLSQDLGRYDSNHPQIQTNQTRIEAIKREIRNEVALTIEAKSKERLITSQKIQRLKKDEKKISDRLAEISRKRVQYEKTVGLVQQRQESLTAARNELDRMRSIQQAAGKVNLFTRIDQPHVGSRPLGMSKRYLVAAGTGLGLFLGIGLVMMAVSPNLSMLAEGLDPRTMIPGSAPSTWSDSGNNQYNPPAGLVTPGQTPASPAQSAPALAAASPFARQGAAENSAVPTNAGNQVRTAAPASPDIAQDIDSIQVRPYGSGGVKPDAQLVSNSAPASSDIPGSPGERAPAKAATSEQTVTQTVAATQTGAAPASQIQSNPVATTPAAPNVASLNGGAGLGGAENDKQSLEQGPAQASSASTPAVGNSGAGQSGFPNPGKSNAATESATALVGANEPVNQQIVESESKQKPASEKADELVNMLAALRAEQTKDAGRAAFANQKTELSLPSEPQQAATSLAAKSPAGSGPGKAERTADNGKSNPVPIAQTLMLSPEQLEKMQQSLGDKPASQPKKRSGGSIFVFPSQKPTDGETQPDANR